MKSLDFKSIMIAAVLCTAIILPAFLNADCEMMAMIAKKGNYISWVEEGIEDWDDPYDFFQFMRDESHAGGSPPNGPNDDGYGVIYYPADGSMYFDETNYFNSQNQAWYKTNRHYNGNWIDDSTWYGDPNPHWQWDDDEPLDPDPEDGIIEPTIMNNNTEASIVLGHDRQGTGSNGNHPFRLQIETNGKNYTFEHNGYFIISEIKLKFYNRTNSLHQGWFYEEGHESNWYGESGSVTDWIDSELYFHYILANIEDPEGANGDVIQGIYNALSYDLNPEPYIEEILIGSNERSNFILSDGFNVYAYRGTYFPDYDIKYVENDTFWGMTTGTESGTQIDRDSLAIFSPYGDIEIIDLADPPEFKSGTIAQSTTWNSNVLITDDITIPVGVTLNIDAEATFASHSTFTINGTVNLQDDSEFNINHSSEVIVENDGLLFLYWGSTLTGATAGWDEAIPPGQQGGDEEYIPGDRIIAQYGGIITTDIPDHFTPGVDPIMTISSSSGELWDGIFIQSPDEDIDYWFVYCDISGISNLSIANVSESQNVANLELYLTDFTDAGQIVARHGHNLTITGNDSTTCNISNNHLTPIVAYESPVYIEYALIEENGRDENGGLLNPSCAGVYLNYASGDDSEILYSVIEDNTGHGIETYYQDVNVDNNTIQTNEKHGIFTMQGTFSYLQNNTILNNLCAEYVGCQSSYNWPEENNTIQDLRNAGGNDQYILIAYEWDYIEESIDVSGNPINHEGNEERFYPQYEAFHFVSRGMNPEAELLQTALTDMRLGNYSTAETGFQEIISQYPNSNEATVAIRGLLFIESYTDQDYMALIDYIDAIQVSEESPLYKAKEDVKTKSYMKDKEFEIAIERLEIIINTSQVPDDVIMAMIDQGYCYMELATLGARFLPIDCTVQTETFASYQAKVRELKTQLSFYPEQENQDVIPGSSNILSSTNYPNPFNPSTTISFNLASDGKVSVAVYNIKGQKVKQLVSDQLSEGEYSVVWDGTDNSKKQVSSGIYFYKLKAGAETKVKKMLLLK